MRISIGDLSAKARVKVPTIRYYERVGLLLPPERTVRSRRCYDVSDVHRLSIIKHLRHLGRETDEIRALLEMMSEGNAEEIEILAGSLDERLDAITTFRAQLLDVASAIKAGEHNLATALASISPYRPPSEVEEVQTPASKRSAKTLRKKTVPDPASPVEQVEPDPMQPG